MQDYSPFNDTCCSVYSNDYMSSSGYTYYKTRQQRRRAKNETGRSMVEMLGVLAVTGVLSVAGVAGFKTAMDKHRANELMNGASMRAVVAMAQLAQGRNADRIRLAEFTNNTISGATFATSASAVPNSNKFAIGVSGVDKSICQNLVNMAGSKVQIAKQADLTNSITANQCEDSNTLAFLFESDKNFGSGTSSNLSSNSSSSSLDSEAGYYSCDNSGYGSYILKDDSIVGTCGYFRACRGGGYYYTLSSAMDALCDTSEAGYYDCEDSGNSPYILKDGYPYASCNAGVCKGGGNYDSLDSALDALCDTSEVGYYYCEDSGNSPYILKDGVHVVSCNSVFVCRGGGNYDSLDSALDGLCQFRTYVYECRPVYGLDGYIWKDGENTGYRCESEGYSYCSGSGEFYSDNSAIESLCHRNAPDSGSEAGYYSCDNSGYGSYILKDDSYVGTCGYPRICRGGGYYYTLSSAMDELCSGSSLDSEYGYYYCQNSSVSPYIERDNSGVVETCGYSRVCMGGGTFYTISSAMDELCHSSLDSGSSSFEREFYYCENSSVSPNIERGNGSYAGTCSNGRVCRGYGDFYSLSSALENLCN